MGDCRVVFGTRDQTHLRDKKRLTPQCRSQSAIIVCGCQSEAEATVEAEAESEAESEAEPRLSLKSNMRLSKVL